MDVMMDLNFNYKTEGFLDGESHGALRSLLARDGYARSEGARLVRRSTSIPVASCESLFDRRDFRPFFEARDGRRHHRRALERLGESLKIAAMADVYEINVAPHNFYGHLSTVM